MFDNEILRFKKIMAPEKSGEKPSLTENGENVRSYDLDMRHILRF